MAKVPSVPPVWGDVESLLPMRLETPKIQSGAAITRFNGDSRRNGVLVCAGVVAVSGAESRAGMTIYELTDVARMRGEDISFFLFLLALSALGVRFLWNYLARDFQWPRLTFSKAFCLTGLLGLAMALALTIISGAREVMTPEAWTRQGSHYRLNDLGSREMRERSMDSLRTELFAYRESHQGKFPPHDYAPEIPAKIWEAPDRDGTRYLYLGTLNAGLTNGILACEPGNFGDERLVLFMDGKKAWLKTDEIHRWLKESGRP
jgi:hypothetical protein